ncbi:MAG: prepilin-type N-terminal cleavage/methylation domain-containing protein, partial [Candidatus Gracilibacteria bacterium]
MKKQNKAFTLVELIVVITIIAILGTIAFVSLQGYSASSRNSVRVSDVSNMKTSLELFHLNAGKYPLPDNFETITYETMDLWYQGDFGDAVVSQLSRNLNKAPTDPLSDKKYIYSVSNNKNEFQILNLLESDLALNAITEVNAATRTVIPRVDGTYNGVFIKTITHIVPVPSILTAEDTTGGLILNDTNIHSQIISGGENIPNIGNVNFNTGALTGLKLSVYTGSVTKNDTDTKKEEIMKIIQEAYTGSVLANDDIYSYILSISGTENLAAILDTVILDGNTSITNTTPEEEEEEEIIITNGDIYWDNVVLLAHMDGTDGSTSFVDEKSHTITQAGNTQISTTESVFGGSSGLFNGNDGDYIVLDNSTDFTLGTGDFTIEFWLKISSIKPTVNMIMDFRPLGLQGAYPTIYYDSAGELKFYTNSNNKIDTGEILVVNNWYNITLNRSNGITRMFVNGIQKGSNFTDANNYLVGANGLFIGTGYSTSTYNIDGYIDELRITKGFSRYSANFSVTTTPFPDSIQPLLGSNSSCKDILDNNPGVLNGVYTIDPENNGTGF